MADTIVDVVEKNDYLQGILKELLGRKFLLPGVFDPKAYLVNDEKIKSRWKKEGTLGAIAMGTVLYNDVYREVYARHAAGEEPHPNAETSSRLEKWEHYVRELCGDGYEGDAEEIKQSCSRIGQYLEFMNRKSQGF